MMDKSMGEMSRMENDQYRQSLCKVSRKGEHYDGKCLGTKYHFTSIIKRSIDL